MDWLTLIPGPVFLILYPCLAGIMIVVVMLSIRTGSAVRKPLSPEAELDPVHMAYLRGGWQAVVEAVVFDLHNRGRVAFSPDGRQQRLVDQTPGAAATPLEREVLDGFTRHGTPRELYRNDSFRSRIERLLAPVRADLEKAGLLRSAEERGRAVKIALLTMAVIALIGAVKLASGINVHKPVALLAIEMFILPAVAWLALQPSRRLTGLGEAHLNDANRRFAWVRREFRQESNPLDMNPALYVALFGAGFVTAGMGYDPYYELFARYGGRNVSPGDGSAGGFGGGCGGSDDGSGGGCGGGRGFFDWGNRFGGDINMGGGAGDDGNSGGGCGGGSDSGGGCGGGGCGGGCGG
ncbi:TIGR04222 domain-containing membrane protein [Heliobacterium undosum]|uniref:TIGR04222 domain-containing membrane protein n=1 Tax=Heliomicrobium undosum TaxID=121734 RepID=A0A845L556_9FIRM|nr:TIGR04222 domain-containing membrane protein [Heliomicrobium undosum]MZP30359.1 TIGR04222 domain-containing membrane protein [Heliomicrobium undosum]